MVYSKRLGLFKPTETTIQKSDTAELNDGNAFLQHVRQYVHAYTHTYLHTRPFTFPHLLVTTSAMYKPVNFGTSPFQLWPRMKVPSHQYLPTIFQQTQIQYTVSSLVRSSILDRTIFQLPT